MQISFPWLTRLVGLATALIACPCFAALGEPARARFHREPDALPLVENGRAASLLVEAADWPGVRRAVADLQADFKRVSGVRPELLNTAPKQADALVIIGTLGHSPVVDQLAGSGKIDVTAIQGQWESWLSEVVNHPYPGVERALVIVGSDKRGTIYGVYELSEQLGVSPWYWWADVTPVQHDAIWLQPGRVVHGPPAVKYRGIFLNDEAPALTNWVRAKFGDAPESQDPPVPPNTANYGREFYARIFEVLLRLRANYLWPAMWSNAFNEDDPENARLADEFGIVMGTSHQEPMLRAQKEWDRRYGHTLGSWNYAEHPEVLEKFWREGVRRNRNFESIVTLGLRGANDTEMAPGGAAANRTLLERIVQRQRAILSDEYTTGSPPQLWCLYKEVEDYYNHGMRVPDDVTLVWSDDNWGNLRRVPTAAERERAGGSGIYYHFDYHGGPRNYQWINTTPLPKIWDQMSLAGQYGANRLWIVNAGHFKGYEVPMEYFLSLAWDSSRWTSNNSKEFLERWAEREFGPEHREDIAAIVSRCVQYNSRRKPEMLRPNTYSFSNYGEAEMILAEFAELTQHATALFRTLPQAKRDAYHQLVLFPVLASATLNEIYFNAGKNELFARQGRASASRYADKTEDAFKRFLALTNHFNQTFAGGRWAHFMDQPVLGYTSWNHPPENSLRHISLARIAPETRAKLGVAIEGADGAWPGAKDEPVLPVADVFNRQSRYLEVFNRGAAPFEFTATANAPWIKLSAVRGTLHVDLRVEVNIDWELAPAGESTGAVTVRGANEQVVVRVPISKSAEPTQDTIHGYVDAAGYVSIDPTRAACVNNAGEKQWYLLEDYGRTRSAMRAQGPADCTALPGQDSPQLHYPIHLLRSGEVQVTALLGPTLNFLSGRPLRYAVSFDDDTPHVVTVVPADYKVTNSNRAWAKTVGDNAHESTSSHKIAKPGHHTLKIWMIDPGVVVQKILIDTGGLRPSYLGPPETFRR